MDEANFIIAQNKEPKKLDEFRRIMGGTNTSLNNKAAADPALFREKAGKGMENEVLNAIKEETRGTSFKADDIELISGQSFPDIVATYFNSPKGKSYYGVEVKTTKEDKWTSIGSSIVESTRVANVDKIFLLFGKLGKRVEFMCRPYEECMAGIAVTHSPRYTIDMELKANESIFDKMGTTYDSFRENKNNIKMVRSYYMREAREKGLNQMPWWMDDEFDVSITLFSDLSADRKKWIRAMLLILFDDVIHSDYRNAVLWMCSRLSILNYNARDLFSAGGVCVEVDGKEIKNPYPQIVKVLLDYAPQIKSILDNPNDFVLGELEQYWEVVDYGSLYEQWVARTEHAFNSQKEKKHIPIRSYIESGSKVTKVTR
jgi:hypothetical protein